MSSVRIGTAGWSYPDWEGAVYPRKKPPGFHPLPFLARMLDCVELNVTFYRLPDAHQCHRWLDDLVDIPRFRFTAKLYQGFTHDPLPAGPEEWTKLTEEYRRGVEPLAAAGRLACVLAQFPESFRYDSGGAARLDMLRDSFGDLHLVLELRHASWFDGPGREVWERHGLSVAWIDLPYSPSHPPPEPQCAGPIGYLRLHGRNRDAWFQPRAGRDQKYDYLYKEEEIAELAGRARRLATRVDETYVITNNHFGGKAVANALELLAALTGSKPPAPAELLSAFPHLAGSTRPWGQGLLF